MKVVLFPGAALSGEYNIWKFSQSVRGESGRRREVQEAERVHSRPVNHVPFSIPPPIHQHLCRETTRFILQDDPPIRVILILIKLGRRG
jgi:hypothetical protein